MQVATQNIYKVKLTVNSAIFFRIFSVQEESTTQLFYDQWSEINSGDLHFVIDAGVMHFFLNNRVTQFDELYRISKHPNIFKLYIIIGVFNTYKQLWYFV